ncbi:hypothetical protein [Micrococcus luteus]|uniref:hypothetical protein n=1 Tax=Micrococcus luteus TaxID=1270 RepID=UPI003D32B619
MLDEAILLAATRADVLAQRLKRSRGSSGVPLRTEETYALLMACSDYERLLGKDLMPLLATWSRTGPGDVRPGLRAIADLLHRSTSTVHRMVQEGTARLMGATAGTQTQAGADEGVGH